MFSEQNKDLSGSGFGNEKTSRSGAKAGSLGGDLPPVGAVSADGAKVVWNGF